jgi:hypothetical protein
MVTGARWTAGRDIPSTTSAAVLSANVSNDQRRGGFLFLSADNWLTGKSSDTETGAGMPA